MPDEHRLEVQIDTVDEERVRRVEAELDDVQPQRWRSARDIGTVITVASSSASGPVNALLVLKDRMTADRDAPTVRVRNAQREEVDLAQATREDLERLVEARDTGARRRRSGRAQGLAVLHWRELVVSRPFEKRRLGLGRCSTTWRLRR